MKHLNSFLECENSVVGQRLSLRRCHKLSAMFQGGTGTQGIYDNSKEKELADLLMLHDALQETLAKNKQDPRPDKQELHLDIFGQGRNPPRGENDSDDENSLRW